MTRLYRAEAPPSSSKPIARIKEARNASGHTEAKKRWFTLDPEALKWYQQDAGPGARTFYVDIPTDHLEKYRVSNSTELIAGRRVSSFSRDPANEFFLPRNLASSRKEAPSLQVSSLE
jgi:hypothetical protein